MPKKLEENLLALFRREAELKQIVGKCRHCFRRVLKNRAEITWHGGEGREYMLAVCTDLVGNNANDDHIKMFAKLIYGINYDETRTLNELKYIREWLRDHNPWRCDELRERVPSHINLDECGKCEERREAYKKKEKKGAAKRKGLAFDAVYAVHSITPIYYDRSQMFWLWDILKKCYHYVDETDILLRVLHDNELPEVIQSKFKNEVLEAARLVGRDREVKGVPQNWIHLADCVYDLETKNRFDATPDYFFTSPLPHKIGVSTDTPTIDRLFTEWVGEGKKPSLYEACAYSMYNGYPIHRIICFFGRGRNGKGQCMMLMERLVGKENATSTDLDRLVESRFEAAKLYNKLAAFVGETNFEILRNTSQIKRLTGEDMISGEFKYKMPFDFRNKVLC